MTAPARRRAVNREEGGATPQSSEQLMPRLTFPRLCHGGFIAWWVASGFAVQLGFALWQAEAARVLQRAPPQRHWL